MGNSNKKQISKRYLTPSNGFEIPKKLDLGKIQKKILSGELAPFHKPIEKKRGYSELCPICMMYYFGGLNQCCKCKNKLCTECFIIVNPKFLKSGYNRFDDEDDDYPSRYKCPFCKEKPFKIKYKGELTLAEKRKMDEEEQKVLELENSKRNSMKLESEERRKKREKIMKKINNQCSRNFSDLSTIYQDKPDDNIVNMARQAENETLDEDNIQNTLGMTPQEYEDHMLKEAIRLSMSSFEFEKTASRPNQELQQLFSELFNE